MLIYVKKIIAAFNEMTVGKCLDDLYMDLHWYDLKQVVKKAVFELCNYAQSTEHISMG